MELQQQVVVLPRCQEEQGLGLGCAEPQLQVDVGQGRGHGHLQVALTEEGGWGQRAVVKARMWAVGRAQAYDPQGPPGWHCLPPPGHSLRPWRARWQLRAAQTWL